MTETPDVPEPGVYRVRYVDHVGAEREMTARPNGATRLGDRWLPVWSPDPYDQLTVRIGPIREVLSYERVGD